MPGRRAAWFACAVVVAVTLVLAHDLAFLARYGSVYGEALVHAGHGQAWTNAVLVCLAIGAALLAAASAQLWRLGLATTVSPIRARTTLGLGRFAASWARLAVRLGAVVAVLLTVQENIERVAMGIRVVDPAILASRDYPAALAIVAAVATVVSLVVALFRWRRDTLLARIRAAVARQLRPVRGQRLLQRARVAYGSIMGRSLGLRAPPAGVAIRLAA